jgi:thiol-disulfide isomerase/thioredoxin
MFRSKLIALIVLAMPTLLFAALKPGDALPNLSTFELEGKLPDKLKGNVILLDFWASWCVPCKASFPVMDDLQKRYASRGLTIVAVSVDDTREKMQQFLKAHPATFTIVRDANQKLAAVADFETMPTSLLIDRAGKIRFIHDGFHGDETAKQYADEIERLLKEPTR